MFLVHISFGYDDCYTTLNSAISVFHKSISFGCRGCYIPSFQNGVFSRLSKYLVILLFCLTKVFIFLTFSYLSAAPGNIVEIVSKQLKTAISATDN